MYKLISRSINKSNKSLTKFTGIYKKISKNQQSYRTASKAYDGEDKEKPTERLVKRRSGTSFVGRAKITFKTLLFSKRSGGQAGKLSTKSFYSTGQKPKDGAPKKFFKDKFSYCLYKNAMEQCESIRKHSPSPGNSVGWNVKSATPQCIKEERHPTKRTVIPKPQIGTSRSVKPKILTEKYIIQKKVKQGFPATTVKVLNKTKIVYPIKKLQYTLSQQTKTGKDVKLEAEKYKIDKSKGRYTANKCNHTVEFIPRKIETVEQQLNNAAKKSLGKKGNSGDSGGQASRGESSGGRSAKIITNAPGNKAAGFTDPKFGAPSYQNQEKLPSIYGEHLHTKGNRISLHTHKVGSTSNLLVNKEERLLIQKHPTVRKATKYGKMDINKKYNILLKMHQKKIKLGHHVIKQNKKKDTLNEVATHSEVDQGKTSDAVEDPVDTAKDPIVSHPAVIQPAPRLNIDPIKYRRSVIVNKHKSYDIDDICLKSNDKSAHRISTNRNQSDNKLWQTVVLKEEPKMDERSNERVEQESPKRAVTPEKVKELIDNQTFLKKQDIAAQNLRDYVTKLQQLRDQTSIKAPSLVQEPPPQKLEKEESVKKVAVILQPGDLFPKKLIGNLDKKRWQASGNKDDVDVEKLQNISSQVSENISKKLRPAQQKRKGEISQFGKLMEHSNRELKRIRVKSGRNHGRTHESKTTKVHKSPRCLLEHYQPSEEVKKANVMKKLLDVYAVKVDDRKIAERSEKSNLKIKEILSRKDTQEKKKKVFMTDMKLVPTKISGSKKLQGDQNKMEVRHQQESDTSPKTDKKSYLPSDAVVSQNVDKKEKVAAEKPSIRINSQSTDDVKKDNVTNKSCLLSDYSKPVNKKYDAMDSAADMLRNKEHSSIRKSYRMSDTAPDMDKEEQGRLKSKSFVTSQNERDMLAVQSLTALNEKIKATEIHLILKAETSPQRPAQKKYYRENADSKKQVPADRPQFPEETSDAVREYRYRLNVQSLDQPENIDMTKTPGEYNKKQPSSIAARSSKTSTKIDPKKNFLLENYIPKSIEVSESDQTDTLTKTVILVNPTLKCLLDNTSFEMATKEEIGTLASEEGPRNVRSNKLDISYPKVTNEMNSSNREYTYLLSAEHHDTDQSTIRETKPLESAVTTKKDVEDCDRESEHGVENLHRRNSDRRNKYVPCTKNDNFTGLNKNSASELPDESASSYQANENQSDIRINPGCHSQKVSDIDSKVGNDDLIDQNVQLFYKKRNSDNVVVEEYEHKEKDIHRDVKLECKVPEQQNNNREEKITAASTDFGNLKPQDVSNLNETSKIRPRETQKVAEANQEIKKDRSVASKELDNLENDEVSSLNETSKIQQTLADVSMNIRHPHIPKEPPPPPPKNNGKKKEKPKGNKDVILPPPKSQPSNTKLAELMKDRYVNKKENEESRDKTVKVKTKSLKFKFVEPIDDKTEKSMKTDENGEVNNKVLIKHMNEDMKPTEPTEVKRIYESRLKTERKHPENTLIEDLDNKTVGKVHGNERIEGVFLCKNFIERNAIAIKDIQNMKTKTFSGKLKSSVKVHSLPDLKGEPTISRNMKSSYTVDDDKIFRCSSHIDKNIEAIKNNEGLRRRILGKRKVLKEEQTQLEEKEPENSIKPSEKVKNAPAKAFEKEFDTTKDKPRINFEYLRNDINRNKIEVVETFDKIRLKNIGEKEDHKNLREGDVMKKLPEVDYDKSGGNIKKKEAKSPTMRSRKSESSVKAPLMSAVEEKTNTNKKMEGACTAMDDEISLSSGNIQKNTETIKKNEELRRKIFGRRKVFKEEQGQLEEEPETGSKSPKNVKDKQTNEIEDINQKRNNGVSVVKFEKLYQKIISGQEDHPKLSEVDVSKKISEIDDEKSRSSREKMDNTKKETKSLIMKSTTFIRKDKSPAEAQMIADYEEESIISKKKKCSYTVDDDKIFLSNSHTGKDIETIKKNEELRRRILGRRNVFKEEQGQLEEEPEIGSKLSEKVKDKPAKVSEKDLDTSENTPRINVENLRNEIEGIDRKRKNALVVEKFEKLCQKIIGGQEDHSKLPEVEVSKKLLEVDYEKTRSIKENMDNTKKENNSMIMKSTTFDGKDKSPAEAQIISDYEDQSIISKKKKISYTVDDDKIFLSSSHTGKNIETIKKNKELRRRIFGRRKVFKEQVQLEEEPEIGSKSSEKVKDKPAKVSEKDRDTSENTRRINVENLRNEIEEIDKKRKNALVVEKFEKLRQKIIGGQEDHSKLLELSKKLPESRSSKEKLILKSTPSAIKDKSPAKAQIIANYEEESIISKKTKCSYTVDDDKTFLTSSHTGTNIETIKKNDELKRSMFGKRKVFKEEPEIGSKPSKKVEGEPTEASEKDRDISENTRRINTDNLRNEIQDINQNRKNAEVVDKFEKLRQRIICARGDLSKLPEVDVSKQLSEKIIGKKMETNPGTTSKNMLFTDKSSNATKRIALAKAWSSRDVKLINEENLKHEIAYRQFLRDINSKNRKKGDIFLASNTSKQDTKEIIEIYAAEKVRNTGKTREARNLVGGKEKTDPSKPQKKKIDSSKIVRKDAKLRSYSAPVKKRIQDTSPDMKSKNQYKNILDDKSDKGNKKTDKLDANHKKKHALSGSSMGIGVTREARNLVGDIDKTELSKPHEGNINFSRILQKDGKRSELAKAWSSRDVKLINEENLKHEIAYRQFLRDINSKNRKKGDISLAVSSNTSKQHAKEIIDIYAAEKVRNTGKTREARNLVGEKDKTDPSKPQKEKINSSKILRKDAKRRSYSAPVRKRTQDTSPDMKSKKQFKYILDDESDVKDKKEHELSGTSMDTGVKTEARKLVGDRDKTDTSKLQKEKTDSPKHTSNIQKKKSSNLFKETPKLAASLIKFNKSIINVKKSSPKINQKPKNDFRHSSLHATTNRSGSPLRSASPVKPSISTAQNKQQETKKTSINSSPETTKQPRKLRRVESASPIRKSPRKLKDTGSEKEKPHELKKYQNILEERKCDDCFSVGGKLAKDAKKEKTDGGHKASGGGKGSTALPSKKKSKLLVKITLQKVQIKKDSSEKCPSTPSIPVKGGKEQKKADNISIPTKAFSEASVTKEKSLATSVIPTFPTTKKMSCRLDDFVCADSFVKSKEEAKEHKASKDPQTELERLLKDPSSRTLSSKYLLKPNKPYAKSCRMNEYETPLSRLLKPESEQTDLKYTEKKTHLLTYESGKTGTHKQQIKSTDSDKQQITMMDAHEFKGTFVDQNQLEPKYQALLRETSPPPKPNPQEDDSKQKQAPEKLEPEDIDITKAVPEAFHDTAEGVEERVGENYQNVIYYSYNKDSYYDLYVFQQKFRTSK